jgi:hypothetical protein
MGIAVLGIDLGKNVCSVVGLDEAGAVVLRRRTRRGFHFSQAQRLAEPSKARQESPTLVAPWNSTTAANSA